MSSSVEFSLYCIIYVSDDAVNDIIERSDVFRKVVAKWMSGYKDSLRSTRILVCLSFAFFLSFFIQTF